MCVCVCVSVRQHPSSTLPLLFISRLQVYCQEGDHECCLCHKKLQQVEDYFDDLPRWIMQCGKVLSVSGSDMFRHVQEHSVVLLSSFCIVTALITGITLFS